MCMYPFIAPVCIQKCSQQLAADAATETTRPTPQRKMSVDPQTAEALERRLGQRPEKQELVERNILKGTHVIVTLTLGVVVNDAHRRQGRSIPAGC